MILTAHQPVYLPWLGLFHRIALADTFIYFDAVQYQTHDWNNRNRIKTPQGPMWLTVPVQHTDHQNKKLFEIEIDNKRPWARKHWRSIEQSYSKAPYFKEYAPFLEDMYSKEWKRLTELNECILKWSLKSLGISIDYKRASDMNFEGKKSALVLDMCKKMKADVFIFGSLGAHYAETDDFEHEGVKLLFQNFIHPTYPQLYGDFVPHLSIIDLLFNVGPESLDIIMGGNIQCAKKALEEDEENQQPEHKKDRRLILRKVIKEDCQLIWEWANDPETRAKSFSPESIAWEDHKEWWRSKINDPDCYIYIGTDVKGYPVGQIRFDCKCEGKEAEVDVHVAPKKRKRGFGTHLIKVGAEKLFADTDVKEVHALIHSKNVPSIRAFEKAGFVNRGTKILKESEVLQFVLRRP